ncbi:MAG: N-acetylmuramoyl-L-alanine amidase [Oscillospiraceae bacterium]|jgi:N-acetylmuramoyl-L-alanine amidase|nr:N-acetylmuramoyl-L-alanine amidase [Oscillospiraceae bacterium]
MMQAARPKPRALCLFLIAACCLAFGASSCAETAPGAALLLAGYRICIDPGHQARLDDRVEPIAPGSTETKMRVAGSAQGVKTGQRESRVNLAVAFSLKDTLTALGAEVLLVREAEDVTLSNVQRAQMANQFGADVFLRLHCNASSNPDRRGVCVYAPLTSAERYYGASEAQMLAWAQAFAETIQTHADAPHARYGVNNTYSGSNWAQMPTFLIEMGYLTNAKDDALLATDAYRQAVIDGIAAFLPTLPQDAHRPTEILNQPVMENHKSASEKLIIHAAPDAASEIMQEVNRNYRVFVLDDLGNGWVKVQSYQTGKEGYVHCDTLEPCK